MAITRVDHGEIYYTALSTDPEIIANHVSGGNIGAKIYITDTNPTQCKIINTDLSLSNYTFPISGASGSGGTSSSVTINDATTIANTLKVNSDGSINVNADITAQVGDIEIKNDTGNPIPTSAIDGGISTLGLKADSAMTVSTNPTTVIGGLKGVFNKLGSVILGSGSAIIGKVGIDQTAGQNTITIASGQNVGINTGANVIGKIGLQVSGADVSNINQVFDVTPAFVAQATITRSTTVTAYTAGQLILGNGANVLPSIDLSAGTGLNLANRRIAITGAFLVSSNGANSAFNGFIDFFNINNPAVTTSLADYVTFNPTATALGSNFVSTLDSMSNSRKYGTTSNLTIQSEILRKCQLDANGRLYFAPVVGSTGYTPASGETLTLVLKFYLLN